MRKLILAIWIALTCTTTAFAADYPQEIARKISSADSRLICERKSPTDITIRMFAGKFVNHRWLVSVMGRHDQELVIASTSIIVGNISARYWVLDSGEWTRVDEVSGENRSWLTQRTDISISGEENDWLKECATRRGFKK